MWKQPESMTLELYSICCCFFSSHKALPLHVYHFNPSEVILFSCTRCSSAFLFTSLYLVQNTFNHCPKFWLIQHAFWTMVTLKLQSQDEKLKIQKEQKKNRRDISALLGVHSNKIGVKTLPYIFSISCLLYS